MPIPRFLQQQVRERADGLCEYCQLPDGTTTLPFQIDHIIAAKHGGSNSLANLAYCCLHCNAYKGPNIAGILQTTGEIVRLFHPRQDTWHAHFAWDGPRLVGLTDIGQVTITVLAINAPYRLELRQLLMAEGTFPR